MDKDSAINRPWILPISLLVFFLVAAIAIFALTGNAKALVSLPIAAITVAIGWMLRRKKETATR